MGIVKRDIIDAGILKPGQSLHYEFELPRCPDCNGNMQLTSKLRMPKIILCVCVGFYHGKDEHDDPTYIGSCGAVFEVEKATHVILHRSDLTEDVW